MREQSVLMKARNAVHEKISMQDIGRWLFQEENSRKWLCPFHDDHHPGSVSVTPDGKHFYCFACGEGGDAIRLTEKVMNLDFAHAVTAICLRFPGTVDEETRKELEEKYPLSETIEEDTEIPSGVHGEAQQKRADADQCDIVYSLLTMGRRLMNPEMDALTLEHRIYLHHRGISDSCIEANQYFSMPVSAVLPFLLEKMASEGLDPELVCGVPGFYETENGPGMTETEGIGIPIHDVQGRITAIQVRHVGSKDMPRYHWYSSAGRKYHRGVSPGAPVDVLKGKRESQEILITEGHFKADAFRQYAGCHALSIQGIHNVSGLKETFRSLEAEIHKPVTVLLGFDADRIENPHVEEQEKKVMDVIHEADPDAEILVMLWDPDAGKGLDDVLNNGLEDRFMTAAEEDYRMFWEEHRSELHDPDLTRRERIDIYDRLVKTLKKRTYLVHKPGI